MPRWRPFPAHRPTVRTPRERGAPFMTEASTTIHQPSAKEIRLVIAASSTGTVFEWYDFFVYGTLAALIGKAFFPSDNETLQMLLVRAGFALGGEYGGASIYVSEHCAPEKRGFYTSFIQAGVVGGFVLSVGVVLACRILLSTDQFNAW